MNKNTRKKELINLISEGTRKFIDSQFSDVLETDALILSLELNLDRANVSRMLNELWRSNELIKIQGRPTLYLHRKALESIFIGSYFPSILSKEDSIESYIGDSNSNLSSFETIIGLKENESLNEIVALLRNSIEEYTYLFVYGEQYIGKEYIIEQVISSDYPKSNLTRMDMNYYYIHKISQEKFIDALDQVITSKKKNKVLLIKNANYIIKLYGEKILESVLRFYKDKSSELRVIFIFDIDKEFKSVPMGSFRVKQIVIPNYNVRTVIEKYKIILSFYQKEADHREKTLSLSQAVLNCFVSSHYNDNFSGLLNEINYSIDMGLLTSIKNDQKIVKIGFDEISDNLLNQIRNVDLVHEQISSISDVFPISDYVFIPNTENQNIKHLDQFEVDGSGRVINYNNKHNSILSFVKDDIRNLSQSTLIHKSLSAGDSRYLHILSDLNKTLPEARKYNETLSFRVFEAITNLNSVFYKRKFSDSPSDFLNNDERYILTMNILDKYFDGELPNALRSYIMHYIDYIVEEQVNYEVSVLVVCHGAKIAEKFAMHINTMSFSRQCYYINYTNELQGGQFSDFLEITIAEINRIDTGGGVVLITDLSPLSNIDLRHSDRCNSKVINFSPITLQLILEVMNLAYNEHKDISQIEEILGNYNENHHDYSLTNKEQKYTDDISEKILDPSLTFLDSRKAAQVLMKTFQNITIDLNISFEERLAIRFIVHSAFLIERIIRGETFSYKKTRDIINSNSEIYQCLERNFSLVNESFGIQIPTDELARVSEIFLELVSV